MGVEDHGTGKAVYNQAPALIYAVTHFSPEGTERPGEANFRMRVPESKEPYVSGTNDGTIAERITIYELQHHERNPPWVFADQTAIDTAEGTSGLGRSCTPNEMDRILKVRRAFLKIARDRAAREQTTIDELLEYRGIRGGGAVRE
ncbi:MAG: hypothetical protein ABIA93_01415 [Candidatus Woesearchaeota archaeon]